MTKLCKNCRYCNKILASMWCEHSVVGISLSDGKPKAYYCHTMRHLGPCGEAGLLFDPKPSLKDKVWQLLKLK